MFGREFYNLGGEEEPSAICAKGERYEEEGTGTASLFLGGKSNGGLVSDGLLS